MGRTRTIWMLAAIASIVMGCNATSKSDKPNPQATFSGTANADGTQQNSVVNTGNQTQSSANPAGAVPSATGAVPNGATAAATGTHDCRDDYPTYGWQKTTDNECSKVKGWMVGAGGMDGVLPSMAFVTCKINGVCMRFATMNNCDYNYWPPGSVGLPVARDDTKYCRKDYKNYTFFRCHINGQVFIGQTTDATSYQDYSQRQGNIVNEVAANLPLNEGCPNKDQN